MAKKTDFERETEREIDEDSHAHKIKIKHKRGGTTRGMAVGGRLDQRPRRQAGGPVGGSPVLPVARGVRAVPVRPGMGGVAGGMPAARPGAVMPTRVAPRPVGAAVPAALGAGTTPRGFRDGGRARQQVGGAAGGRYPDRVVRPWGDEDTSDLNRSRGRYVGESKVPRDDYDKGGHITAKERRDLPSSDFALPGKGEGPEGKGSGSYPIDTPGRARSALSRGEQHASPSELSTIRRKVRAKYPDMDVAD